MMLREPEEETREFVKKFECPEWFVNLFWKEVEENFATTMVSFIQDRPDVYLNAFAVKIYEMSRLARYE